MYQSVLRSDIVDALVHIRDLHRRKRPAIAHDTLAFERREVVIKDLLSNLHRTAEHPTLRTLIEIADVCSLTLESAHRLFGYSLSSILEHDLYLNGGRTHIVESYPFERDLLIDLPARIAPPARFEEDAFLQELVPEWQTDIPIRVLEEEGWIHPGAFYVYVGTEDSLGSGIPPGALALVEPLAGEEQTHPNPRQIYLLQFGNGYRCSRCVITRGKLHLISSGKHYLGREEFLYPHSVRIAGRVRMFAVGLPVPDYQEVNPLSQHEGNAELILPWEHSSRDRLFATKYLRFKRAREADLLLQEFLKGALHAKLSGRSERRYRRPSASTPHVNALIHLTLAHFTRYTDVLRAGKTWESDEGRFSLEGLLKASSLKEVESAQGPRILPAQTEMWQARRSEFGGWPLLLSTNFPKLSLWGDRIARLGKGCTVGGLDPAIYPGSWLLLEKLASIPDGWDKGGKTGWSRPLFAFRKGVEIVCGYLDRDGDQYAIVGDYHGSAKVVIRADQLGQLTCVTGVAVPL